MRRTITWLAALAPVVLLLASCGLLFAPMEERSNPLDPKAQLVVLDPPLVYDGTVSTANPNFDSGILSVSNSSYALIRFDLSGLPAVITVAHLILEYSDGEFQSVELYPIVQENWNDTVTYSSVAAAGFLDPVAVATGTVADTGPWSWDMTDAIGQIRNGVALKGAMTLPTYFYSSSGSTLGPRLHVEGYNN